MTAQLISWLVTITLLVPALAAAGTATDALILAAPDRPLPACRYADVTVRTGLSARPPLTLVDIERRLPRGYAPRDLVSTSGLPLDGATQVRRIALRDLRALARAARDADHRLAVRTGYRSEGFQGVLFRDWVAREGREAALRSSARPGHSEHQLGVALDFASPGRGAPWDHPDWATTPTGGWLAEHAWEYGFVMSYPKGGEDRTCYGYEPWHYRYVGREAARAMRVTGLTLREYLWQRTEGDRADTGR